MRFGRFAGLFLLGAVFLFCSCSAPKIKTTALAPAKYHDAAKLKKIAFLPFDGPGGKEFAMELEGALGSIQVGGSPFFTLVERQKIDQTIQEQRFSHSGLVAVEDAVRLGKVLGARGIVTGAVTTSAVNDQHYREARQTCVQRERRVDKDGKVREGACIRWSDYYVGCTYREAVFSVSPKFIDVETGRVVYASTLSDKQSSQKCEDRSTPLATRETLLAAVKNRVINGIKKDIAPHYVTMEIQLMDDAEGMNKEARELFKSGLEFAENNRLDRACELWNRAMPLAGQSPALLYNVAFCLEIQGDLDRSLAMYRQADRLTTKPDNLITAAMTRLTEKIDARDRLKDQVR
ncbi:MAG: CsgG/HfaB family protein [Pseudomonadota bacterium]|nr:CsgG/HfaB family protein [Pseudomonadota bacterium]